MGLLLKKNQRLVMIGDSITDAGRSRPVGTFASGLGDGYVSLVNSLLTATYPELGIEVINVGIGGNTVRDLKGRWQTDVIDLKPDWLTIMIGTNDVWRQFDSDDPAAAVQPADFKAMLGALVLNTKPLVKGLILMTPFLVEPNPSDPFRERMEEYCTYVKDIGASAGVTVVDIQEKFNQVMAHVSAAHLAPDRVHPSQPGHTVLAKAALNALGFVW